MLSLRSAPLNVIIEIETLIKLSINKKSISLVIIALLGSFYLQTSCAAPATQNNPEIDRDLLVLSHKILLLEHEISTIKKQQERIENLSHEILKIEQNLKALQNYVKQDAGQDSIYATTRAAYPEKSKVNFFVPAGW